MEEEPEQLMKEAEELGFPEVRKFVEEGKIIFRFVKGEKFAEFVTQKLPKIAEEMENFRIHSRIVMDPLTPLLWEFEDKIAQRNVLSDMFKILKRAGTCLITVEEPRGFGKIVFSEETSIPLYLADGVIHLQYMAFGGIYSRTLRILKMRATNHGEGVYPFGFFRGLGMAVFKPEERGRGEEKPSFEEIFRKYAEEARGAGEEELRNLLLGKIEQIKLSWNVAESPEEFLKKLIERYRK